MHCAHYKLHCDSASFCVSFLFSDYDVTNCSFTVALLRCASIIAHGLKMPEHILTGRVLRQFVARMIRVAADRKHVIVLDRNQTRRVKRVTPRSLQLAQ